jgi:hypothetical protein
MTYRRSGSLWSLLRSLFAARSASRGRRAAGPNDARRRLRRALRRWLR